MKNRKRHMDRHKGRKRRQDGMEFINVRQALLIINHGISKVYLVRTILPTNCLVASS
jgi:hypothetical protein